MYKSKCSICHKSFEHRFPTQHVCEECKNRPCVICGKPFKRVEPYDQKYCSKECRRIGKKDPKNNEEWTAKRKKTLQAKYGVDNISQLPEIANKISICKKDPEFYAEMKAELEAKRLLEPKPKLIRKCVLCGQEFEATGSQTTCKRDHFRNCVICGDKFLIKHVSDSRQTCSKECAVKLRRQSMNPVKRTCEYCGKEFYSPWPQARYCKGPHFKICNVCGKRFEVKLSDGTGPDSLPMTCSEQCREKYKIQTCLEKYGVEYVNQLPEYRERFRQQAVENADKQKQTCFERYGVENVSQSPEIKAKISEKISSSTNQLRTEMQ